MALKARPIPRKRIHLAVLAGLLAVVPFSSSSAAPTDIDIVALANAQAREVWHTTLDEMGPPAEGCWSATYPSTIWKKEICDPAPTSRSTPPIPPASENQTSTRNLSSNTVGNGVNYAARTWKLTKSAKGSFPTVYDVTHESARDPGQKKPRSLPRNNVYSLQINTNLSDKVRTLGNVSPACASKGYAKCATWLQFIYSTTQGTGDRPPGLYMQNWLFIGEGERCPLDEGWHSQRKVDEKTGEFIYNGCYKNSTTARVPLIEPSDLAQATISGAVKKGGSDTVTLRYGDQIYSVQQPDSTLGIADTWRQSEFNIEGDSSNFPTAYFNPGAYFTVQLEAYDGSPRPPECIGPNAGTTFEGNNLTLGNSCEVSQGGKGGAKWIRFGESNIKGYPNDLPDGRHFFDFATADQIFYR